ncbi:hypothetical protein [Thermotoga sp. KOL6]|uniref:hypothetical protein n=1 Tax=Thermotoga sp. KOL6 TaxID=126741 RepID=UPI000C7691C7|nr:hypothetical protein [Thermotoga sp. KOL6]PLV60333.1 hypothetical protein AS005_03370 [Thermotoga sp. KOL6]
MRKFVRVLEIIGTYLGIFLLIHLLPENDQDIFTAFFYVPLFVISVRYDILYHILNMLLYTIFAIILAESEISFGAYTSHVVILSTSFAVALINKARLESLRDYEEKLRRAESSLETLERQANYFENVIDTLKTKLAYETEGVSSLFLKLTELPRDDLRLFAHRFLEIVAEFFDLEGISIWVYNQGFLRIFASVPSFPDSHFSTLLNDSLVVKNALRNGSCSIVEIIDSLSDERFREPWLAIRIGENEKDPFGVIVVERMNPGELDKVENHLKALAGWFYISVREFQREEKGKIEEYKLPDGTYDLNRYNSERQKYQNLYAKYGLPFSEICVKVPSNELRNVLNALRKDDLVAKIFEDVESVQLKILLPLCDEIGKISVMERLRHEIEDIDFVNC